MTTSGASAATASAVGGGTPSTTSSSSSSSSSSSTSSSSPNATTSVLRRAGTGTTSQSRPSSSSSSSISLGNDICNNKGRNRKRGGSKVSFTFMTFLCAFLAAATMLSFLQQQQRRRSGGATPISSSSHQQLRGGGSKKKKEKESALPSPQHQPLWRRYLERAAHANDKTGEGNGKGKTNRGTVAVTILFTSDVHGHYDSDRTSRLSYVIDTVRRATANNNDNDQEHFLLLDGGDSIFGSSHINETHVSSIMNHLQYDAMALGNHEFDVGPTRLEQFADMVNFPILASNVIVDNKDRKGEQKKDKKESPVLTSSSSFVQGHTVLDLGHTISTKLGNVCLLGVTAKEYNPLVSKNIQFDDEIDSVVASVSRLSGSARRRMLQKKSSSSSSSTKNKESSSSMKKASSSKMIQKKKKEENEKDVVGAPPCQRTILLSHAGIDVDRMFVNALRKTTTKKKEEEGEKTTRVDVVLGGHSHVLLGPPPPGVHSEEEGSAAAASSDVETNSGDDDDDDDGGDDAPDAEYGYILKDASLPLWSSSKRRRSVNDKEVPKGGKVGVGGPPFLVHAGSNGRHAALLRLEYDYDDDVDASSGGDERKLELASAHGELVPLDEEHGVLTDPTFDAWWNDRIAPTLLKDGEGGAAAGGAAGPVRYADIRIVDAGEGNKKRHKKRSSSSSGFGNGAERRVCNQACRSGECFSGNLVTDAMRACVEHGPCKAHVPTTVHLKVPSAEDADGAADKGEPYIAGTMALLESGTLRGCIAPSGRKESFDEMLPWPNALVLMVMDGATVRRMLEHGIRSLPPGKKGANNNDNNKGGGGGGGRQGGAFLQVSGLQYRYDGTDDDDGGTVRAAWLTEEKTRRPPSSPRSSGRVTFTDDATSTASCRVSSSVSTQIDLDDASRYLVVVSDWLASGGDGFGDVVSSAETVVTTDIPLRETLLNYTTTSPTIQYESRSARGTGASSSSALRQAISGFLGGAVAFIVTYPVYTAFVRRSMHKTVHGSLSRLFDGAALGTLATALSNAIYFVVYNSASIASMSAFSRSSIAAIANSVVTSPLWVIVTREQLSLDKAGAWAVAQAVYKEEGIRGFFDGLSTNLLMCVFPVVRQIALELIVDLLAITHQNDVALAASGASLVATIVTFPIQKWRIRLQSGEKDSSKRSIWHECCDGVAFKVMDSCLKTFVLFLVKEHSDMIMCILEG